MKYTIVQSEKIEDLINKVNEHLAEGWQPLGGVVVADIYNKKLYLQTLQK